MAMTRFDLASLSREERLRLLDELWDSLAHEPDALALSDAQRTELDRRLDELDRGDAAGIPWEDVLARIRGPRA